MEKKAMTEHGDTRKELSTVLKNLKEIHDSLSEFHPLPDEYHERIELQPENGVYDDPKIKAPDGGSFRLSSALLWASNFKGEWLVDVPHSELPERELTDCTISITSEDGIVLFEGDISEVSIRGFGGLTTLVVEP